MTQVVITPACQAAPASGKVEVPRAVLSWHDVVSMTGVARNTLRAEIARGRFPKPRQITQGRRGFIATEVERWLQRLPKVCEGSTRDRGRKCA